MASAAGIASGREEFNLHRLIQGALDETMAVAQVVGAGRATLRAANAASRALLRETPRPPTLRPALQRVSARGGAVATPETPSLIERISRSIREFAEASRGEATTPRRWVRIPNITKAFIRLVSSSKLFDSRSAFYNAANISETVARKLFDPTEPRISVEFAVLAKVCAVLKISLSDFLKYNEEFQRNAEATPPVPQEAPVIFPETGDFITVARRLLGHQNVLEVLREYNSRTRTLGKYTKEPFKNLFNPARSTLNLIDMYQLGEVFNVSLIWIVEQAEELARQRNTPPQS